MIPLIWLNFAEGPARCCWDQDIIDTLCPPHLFLTLPQNFARTEGAQGAVFVMPARYNGDHVPKLNDYLRRFDWAVLMLTSDEEGAFPWHRVQHPRLRIWVQTPHPVRHKNPSLRFFPLGSPHGPSAPTLTPDKDTDIFFAGQVNHHQRDLMLKTMESIGESGDYTVRLDVSGGFTQGLERPEYLRLTGQAKIVPCPSGPMCAESFRAWEALEYGAIPIVDTGPLPDSLGRADAGYPKNYWELLLRSQTLNLPQTKEWEEGEVRAILRRLDPIQIYADYQWYKHSLRNKLLEDVEEMSATPVDHPAITVLVPTSPTPIHPSPDHLFETLSSIRDRLPYFEIIVMFDGIRAEQEHLRTAYEDYQRQALWYINHSFNMVPLRFDEHLHQVEMTRRALEYVKSPLILFVEHDTPLVGDIDWRRCVDVLLNNSLNMVRFYHEAEIQAEHGHLMLDQHGDFLNTRQWSQRPHLAQVGYYRRILTDYFTDRARTFIEDKMHGVVQDEDFNHHRIAIYNPDGNPKRSTHLDSRGDEPKFVERLVF